MKIAIVGALPHELKPLLKRVKPQRQLRAPAFRITQATYLSHEIMIVQTGIGIRNAEKALTWVLREFNADFIFSIGFAGALYEGARIGDLVMARNVSLVSGSGIRTLQIHDKGALLNRLSAGTRARAGSFFTLETLMQKKAVKLLVPTNAAFPVCEMETFPLAEVARQRQLPFLAVRSITDLADEEIPPEFLEVADSSGRDQVMRAAGLLLRNPWLIPTAAKLGRRSRTASMGLLHAFDALAHAL
jgi:adenosylhomocysteine nucleosidase